MVYRVYSSLVLLLMVTVLVSWRYYFYDYQTPDTINIKYLPKTVDNWTSQELPIDKIDLSVLETNNVLMRRYTDPKGRHVYLYLAYSQFSPKVANSPEVAYEGSNISIIDKGKKNIIIASSNLLFRVNWLLLDNNENQQMAYYWFKVGGIYTHSYWKQRVLAAFNNIWGKKIGNALIRVSTDIDDEHQKEAINILNEFSCLIIPQLYQYLP
jgi:EpsI family protein